MRRVKLSRYWLFQLVGWGSFALVNTFFAYSFNALNQRESTEVFFGRLGVFIILGILSSHLMRFVIIQLNTLQKGFDKQVLQFLFITFLFSLLSSAGNIYMLSLFDWLKENEKPVFESNLILLVLVNAFNSFIFFFIWNLIYFIYHFITKSRKQQMDTLQLETMVKELELKTIKAHINPHFIFNALNSIRALIDENPHRARRAVTELSNILRSSLKSEKGETVPFNQELKIVKDYLALENMRFEDRLKVEYEVKEDTLEEPVPPMMLQTLVENAIKHGISQDKKGGLIKIISGLEGSYHFLTVQNTGYLNGKTNIEGFGLASTQERLQLLYGEKAKFEIFQLDNSLVQATIKIPLNFN